nr:cation:proton antiporter subunit C [Paremcibacter congregatus]
MSDMDVLGLFNYWVFVILLMLGFFAIVARTNLIKKVIGLSIFQAAVFLMYISMGKVEGGTAPIIVPGLPDDVIFSNPLPQVLILTAIVVGISTTALALAMVVRIKEEYGTVEEDEIRQKDSREKETTS